MKPTKIIQTVLILAMVAMAGCSPAATATLQPTSTPPPPTATDTPTQTTTNPPPATATLEPTATVQPTPTSFPTLLPPTAGQVQALDMTSIDKDLTTGFARGFITGNYAYFVTWNERCMVLLQIDCPPVLSKIIRVDVNNFTAGGATELDLAQVATHSLNTQFSFTDGRYGYFMEWSLLSNDAFRVDLLNFGASGVTVLSLDEANPNLSFSNGVFSDGHYAYFSVGEGTYVLARADVQTFNPTRVEFLNLDNTQGCIMGNYGYFPKDVTASDHNSITRLDLNNFTDAGVTIIHADVNQSTKVLYGYFCNAGYFYIAPNTDGKILRVDAENFTTSGITALDLSKLDPGLNGYVAAFTDGHYGYFLPNYTDTVGDLLSGTGKVARVDLANFTASGVTWLDLTHLNSNWNNFMDGLADSHYIYLEPGDYAKNGATLNTNLVRISLDYAGWTK